MAHHVYRSRPTTFIEVKNIIMKLNNSFLGVLWETDSFLKDFFTKEHSSGRQMDLDPGMANADSTSRALWMLGRMEAIEDLCNSNRLKMYYLTKAAQDEAAMIKYQAANMKWLRQIKDQRSMYITGKKEFFRFNKEGLRITVLQYYKHGEGLAEMVQYEGFALDLEREEIKTLPTQDQAMAHRFIKLLLFMELSEIKELKLSPGSKIKYGKGGDDKLLNDTGLKNVYLVNAHWNKIIIVNGQFTVRGHFRVQPCGPGRKDYKLIWIEEFTKGSYIRRSGKELHSQ
jgi:hypothetical protein